MTPKLPHPRALAHAAGDHLTPLGLLTSLVVLYLLLQLAFAAFAAHPSTGGWVGLGLVSVLALALVAAAHYLYPRTRTNTDPLHARAGRRYRLLVVSDAEIEPEELASAVVTRTIGRPSEVRIVAPVVAPAAHFLASDEERERAGAANRLRAAVEALDAVDVHPTGAVASDDPLEATADALVEFPADEILFVGSLPWRRDWADRDFEREARDRFGVHCTTVYG